MSYDAPMNNIRGTMALFSLLLCIPRSASLNAAEIDYEQPTPLTGTILERGTDKVLFRFKRTARRSGDTVRVLREFTNPDGSLAARERVVYTAGKLVSFQLDELQTGAGGTTTIAPDPRTAKQKLWFDWTSGQPPKKKTDSEDLDGVTVVSDMFPHFVTAHWNELARGEPMKFRFVAPSRLETVGFKLVKDSETTWRGQPVIRLRMEPTSFLIAQIVDPLFFIVEKTGPHRILEYDGRTTPKSKRGNEWKDLDARTVYQWP